MSIHEEHPGYDELVTQIARHRMGLRRIVERYLRSLGVEAPLPATRRAILQCLRDSRASLDKLEAAVRGQSQNVNESSSPQASKQAACE